MSHVVDTLTEMGFSKERAELAVSKTGSQDVQVAMDWLLTNEGEIDVQQSDTHPIPNPDLEMTSNANPEPAVSACSEPIKSDEDSNASLSQEALIAKSIKCDDCGKLFKSNEEVEFHAAKTGHENFSESTEEKKALSEEEKKEQLAKIEAKLRQRRLEREAREKEEALLREKVRIKSGKELLEAKKKHEEIEMKKIIEQRKREKEEERLARQRVKEQIEQDRLARKAKFSSGASDTTSNTEQPPAKPLPPVTKPSPTQNYTDVKLQIKLLDGSTLVQTFGVKEPLSAVRLFVEMNRKDAELPFKLMTNFPRRVFSIDDYDKPLESLGLAPSATLFVSKS